MARNKWAGKSISYSCWYYANTIGSPKYKSYIRCCPYHKWRRKRNKNARRARRRNRR